MRRWNVSGLVFFSAFMFASVAHAGKTELTSYYPSPYGEYTNLKSTGDSYFATASGNVGIGTTTATALLEVACPSGFQNVKAASNQLGCMQTDEANSGTGMTWENAEDYCFDNYGGRLPSTGEWFIAMNNYNLTNEADDWERNDDEDSSDYHACSGSGGITLTSSALADTTTQVFRCWIPR